MQSMSENDFECFASTGVNTPETTFPNSGAANIRFPRSRLIVTDLVLMPTGLISELPYRNSPSTAPFTVSILRRTPFWPRSSARHLPPLTAQRCGWFPYGDRPSGDSSRWAAPIRCNGLWESSTIQVSRSRGRATLDRPRLKEPDRPPHRAGFCVPHAGVHTWGV